MVQAKVLGQLEPYHELRHGWAIRVGYLYANYEFWLEGQGPGEYIRDHCNELIRQINFLLAQKQIRYQIPEYHEGSELQRFGDFTEIVDNLRRESTAHAVYFIIGGSAGMLRRRFPREQALDRLEQVDLLFDGLDIHAGALVDLISPITERNIEDGALLTAVKRLLKNVDLQMTILFVAADPKNEDRLRSQQEVREVTEAIQAARLGSSFKVQFVPSCRPHDLGRAIDNFKPRIIHFAGHGNAAGLAFEDDQGNSKLARAEALGDVLCQARDWGLEAVVLNACSSAEQSQHIRGKVPLVVAMEGAVGDANAILFARLFYGFLAAGRSFCQAFEGSLAGAQLEEMPGDLRPRLFDSRFQSRRTETDDDEHRDESGDDFEEEYDDDQDFDSRSEGSSPALPAPTTPEDRQREELAGQQDHPHHKAASLELLFQHLGIDEAPFDPRSTRTQGSRVLAMDPFMYQPTAFPMRDPIGAAPNLVNTFTCDVCYQGIPWGGVLYNCDICKGGDFDVCEMCFEYGKGCLEPGHLLIEEVTAWSRPIGM